MVLGSTPPWSGYSCLAPKQVASSLTNVAPGVNATLTVTCPYATLAVGGGFSFGSPSFAVSKDARSGNGWQIIAKNTSGTTQAMVASAVCLIGAPSNASVSSIQGNVVNVANNSNSTSTAACPSGQLIGGGYTTTLSGNSVMRIYNDNRTTSTGSTWQVSAQNNTGASKTVTSFAYCLQNTNYSFSQASGTLQSDGSAGVSCGTNGPSLGGGFGFPRLTAYKVWTNQLLRQSAWWVQMDPPPANGDANAKSYVECLSHP